MEKGFWAMLFDMEFKSFIALKIVKVLYILGLILIAIGMLVSLFAFLGGPYNRGYQSFDTGLLIFLQTVLVGFLSILGLRVGLEVLVVLFRIADDAKTIADDVREKKAGTEF